MTETAAREAARLRELRGYVVVHVHTLVVHGATWATLALRDTRGRVRLVTALRDEEGTGPGHLEIRAIDEEAE